MTFVESLHIYDQSLAVHKDAVLHANTWESDIYKFIYFIHPKKMFPSLCYAFLFSTVVNQAAEFGQFL